MSQDGPGLTWIAARAGIRCRVMRGRSWAVAVVAALVFVGALVAVRWPDGPSTSVSSRGGPLPPGRSASFTDSVPVTPGMIGLAAAPPVVLAPAATPAPAPAETSVGVAGTKGRTLRVGVAGPATSPATIGDAVVGEVGLYSAPGEAAPDDVLDNPTSEGLPVVFLVQQRQGDWLQVQVSMRPNQATAWVHASDVTLRQTPYHVFVDVAARRLTAYQGQNVVLQADVAPGTDDTPTPLGDFFVDGIVQPSDPTGPYGAFQISVAAFSNVLYSFGSGNGQIAIHGTNDPALIGTPASHGCVRMTNEDITRLVSMIPTGTPVRIVG